MSEVLLLGAGASIAAGVPDAVTMADRIIDLLQYDDAVLRAYDFTRTNLAVPARRTLPTIYARLDDWLTSACSTHERHAVTAWDFVRGYPFSSAAADESRTIDVEALYNAVALLAGARKSMDGAFLNGDFLNSFDPQDLTDTLTFIIDAVVALATVSSHDSVTYLRPLLAPLQLGAMRLVVATLNYDNTIELVASNDGT